MEKIHEKCVGCAKVTAEDFCAAYPKPSIWWEKRGGCAAATHTRKLIEEVKKVNPLKASKKKAKGR